MKNSINLQSLLTWNVRVVLYLISLSILIFANLYCTNVCPYIDGLDNNSFISNLFIIFLFHIVIRELIYYKFNNSFKNTITLARHAYYMSILSWIITGIFAMFFHLYLYPDFAFQSHLKLLSAYWLLGAGFLAQLEYVIFENKYKKLLKNVSYYVFNEQIAKRIKESFLLFTIIPAITILMIFTRYQSEGNYNEHMVQEITYILALFVSVAIITAIAFSDMLKNDTEKIISSINSIKQGNYNISIEINRADELGEISSSVEHMAKEIDLGIKEIYELNKEISNTQKEVVFTMGSIGETRSKETGNHVKRVAEYSKLLALYCGLNEEEAEMLKQASPMHDIGKVGIPDSILNKPGRFDEEERKIMDTHAKLGWDMLKHSSRHILQAAAVVAHQHHEKWDGTGYPQGLKGEKIHIYGRITALADVFDALGSDRCYKKAWDDEKIFNLFKEERGKHFDPNLIDIFFEHLDEFLKIRDSLKDKLN